MAAGSIQPPGHDQPAVLVKLCLQQVAQAWMFWVGQVDKFVGVDEAQPLMTDTKRIHAVLIGHVLPIFAPSLVWAVLHCQVGDKV